MAREIVPATIDYDTAQIVAQWHNVLVKGSSARERVDSLLEDVRTVLELTFMTVCMSEEQEEIDDLLIEAFDKLQRAYEIRIDLKGKFLNAPCSMTKPVTNTEWKEPGYCRGISPRGIRPNGSLIAGLVYS